MSRTLNLSTIIIGLIFVSCSANEEEKTAPPDNAQPAASSAESGNPLTAPVDYLGAVVAAKGRAESKLAITSVSQAVQVFIVTEGRLPASLEELVSKQYLPRLPQIPQNLDYKYDPATGAVDLVGK